MVSPKNKRRFLQILPFGIISAVFSFIYSLIEKGILGDAPFYPSTGNPYNYNITLSVIIAFTFGLLIGFIEILYLNKWFSNSSFLKKIVYKTLSYFVLVTIFTLAVSGIGHAVEMGVGIMNEKVWDYLIIFMSDLAFWSIDLYIALGIGLCLFYTEVSDNIGQGVLMNFFTGKYHQPIEEERIFIFLDMKSSTTIAEQLGHVKYFSMLKKYYSDLSDPIIEYGGEIYQYVGDEIIVTWKHKEGIRNNHCLHCFFAMKAALSNQAEKYNQVYGVVPTFKAGIHLGEVTSGEIGVIKREITFSGDVLNTTARIQGLCNTYNVDLLTSEKFVNTLDLSMGLEKKALGETELRGRNEKINLYTLEKTAHKHA